MFKFIFSVSFLSKDRTLMFNFFFPLQEKNGSLLLDCKDTMCFARKMLANTYWADSSLPCLIWNWSYLILSRNNIEIYLHFSLYKYAQIFSELFRRKLKILKCYYTCSICLMKSIIPTKEDISFAKCFLRWFYETKKIKSKACTDWNQKTLKVKTFTWIKDGD